ncbi:MULTISPECIES: glycosyltransferase [Spirosoma]|nr:MULTISPECIES: glycosyltransferase [Spirosoma]
MMKPASTGVLPDTPTDRPLFDSPPSSSLKISVVVPVRNEAHHLTDTLDALRNQQNASGQAINPIIFEVLLLANNCTDCSYDVARRYQQQHPDFPLLIEQITLPPARANIGTVRRLLMDAACRRLTTVGNSNGIIASTDGDTVVDSQWIYYTLCEIENGSDAVGGRILTRPDGSAVRLFHLRDVMYRTLVAQVEARLDPHPHDPWPRHFQHFGASIAVTCRMYRQAGGLPEKPFLEDEAFYRAMLRTDAKVRKSPNVRVFTSTRTQGQVEIGFSEQLRYWATMGLSGQRQLAEPAEAVITRIRHRHRLRRCWLRRAQNSQPDCLVSIAQGLLIDPTWLATEFAIAPYFGQLWEKVDEKMAAGRWAAHWQPVPITTAIQTLRAFLQT